MSMNCTVCGKPLSAWDGKTICSGACRQRKSRNKRLAQQRAFEMGFQIDAFSKMLTEGTINVSEARALINEVWDRVFAFHENIQRVAAVEAQKAAEAPKKKKRR